MLLPQELGPFFSNADCSLCNSYCDESRLSQWVRRNATLVGTLLTRSISFPQDMLLLGSNHFQACKLAPDIGHLSGKFQGFDWRILSLTGHVDSSVMTRNKKIYFHLRKTNVMQRCIQSASLCPGTHSFFFWTQRILNEGSNWTEIKNRMFMLITDSKKKQCRTIGNFAFRENNFYQLIES